LILFAVFFNYFLREYKDQFYSPWLWVSLVLSSFGNLFIYWCTSKAFGANAEFQPFVKTDYFTFVLLGEVIITTPLVLLTSFSQSLRSLNDAKAVDVILSSRSTLLRTVYSMGFSTLCLQVVQLTITIILGAVLFSIQVDFYSIPSFLFLLLSSLPFFCGLGLFNGAFVMFFRRGDNFLLAMTGMLAVVSGVYFPVEVLPGFLRSLFKGSPLTHLIDTGRELLLAEHSAGFMEVISLALPWLITGGLSMIIGQLCFQRSLKIFRTRGESQLIWK